MLSNNLNLFSTRQYQNEMFGAEYMTVRPFSSIGEGGPIDFYVKDNKEYIDLSETVLSLKLRIATADGKPIVSSSDGKDNVALVNNAMHSVFSDVQVYLNGKKVDGGDGYYGYRSMISTVFRFSTEVQKKQLFAQGFERDECRAMEAVTNSGFVTRKAWTAGGASRRFFGKLNCSLFNQERYLIPNVKLQVRLDRAKDAFALFTNVAGLKPKIIIEEAKLHFLIAKVSPHIHEYHAMELERGAPAIYELSKVQIATVPITQKSLGVEKDEVFYGNAVPSYLFMAMVSNTAFYGDYALNPYNFKHYNIKSLLITRDDERIPFETFEPDFRNGDCLEEYMSLYQSNALLGKNTVLPITFEEFQNGYTHFQWNLSDDRKGINNNPNQRANLKLEIKFHEQLPEDITIIFYGIFDSTVQVYGDDHVLVDGV